jgi:hypothetical protein
MLASARGRLLLLLRSNLKTSRPLIHWAIHLVLRAAAHLSGPDVSRGS